MPDGGINALSGLQSSVGLISEAPSGTSTALLGDTTLRVFQCCIDSLTAGLPLTIWAVLAYFASLALEGVLSSAQESLLVVFGQKMTHALRSEMSHKLTRLPAATLVAAIVPVLCRYSNVNVMVRTVTER